jgi:tetratricopeptide (TPR) repeat protein
MRVITVLAFLLCLTDSSTYSQSATSQQGRQLTQPETSPREQKFQKRVALVIGNSAYQHVPRLTNPVNDAHDMAETLKSLGFDVIHEDDQSADKIRKLIKKFGEKLRSGTGVGLFYYAGHGTQVNGRNYLIPIEADALRENSMQYDAVDVNQVLAEMESAGNELNVVILDACRSNPFTRSWRSGENGLAQINTPEGTLIAYATSPGRVASDGTGRNGLYTAQLLRFMKQPGLSLVEVFMQAGAAVRDLSGRTQIPWVAMSITSNFYFSGSLVKADRTADPTTSQREFWDSIKNSTDPEDFRAYLKEFPDGLFASLARNNLRRIEEAIKKTTQNINESKRGTSEESSSISKQDQERANSLIASGDTHRMSGEYDSAITDLTEAIKLNPNLAMAYALRGDSYHSKRKLDLAILDLTQAIRIYPTFSWAYSIRAAVYIGKGESNLALSDLNEVIRLEPKNYWAYQTRAGVYRVLGKNDLAIADEQRQINDLSEAIRLHPNSAQAYVDRCDAYRMNSKLDLALTDCNDALRFDPNNVQAYATRGNIYHLKGMYEQAISDLGEAIRISPTYYWAYERRAESYERVGLTKLAEADRQKARELQGKR